MKWFKHDSDASLDAKLQEILLDYGAAGYGLYWYCVELIAKDVTPRNITFELEHDVRVIARNLNLSVKEVNNMMQKMIELGLFDISKNNKLACIKLVYRLDDSTRKGAQIEGIIDDFYRENPDLIGKIPNESGKVLLDIEEDIDKEEDLDIDRSPRQKKTKGFVKPTLQEVANHIIEKGYDLDAERFIAYYESNGWMVGKVKMKNWQSALVTWDKNQKKFKQQQPELTQDDWNDANFMQLSAEEIKTGSYISVLGVTP